MRDLPDPLAARLRERGRDLTILVVRLGAMGDIVRTLPAVRLIRRALSEARILWIVDDRWRIVLDGHADLDDVVALERKAWDSMLGSAAGWLRIPGSVRRLRQRLRALRADLVIDFHGNLRSGIVGRLSGARTRLGYDGHQQREGNRLFTTHRVASGDRRTPRLERNLDLVRALDLPVDPLPRCGLPLVDAGREQADRIAAGLPVRQGGFAVVNPGASAAQAYKKPPGETLAAACRHLARRDVLPLIVYGPGEEPDARSLSDHLGPPSTLAPPTGLAALCALLARARVFVGGDSGPLHLACAVGCPVVGVYGPTDPRVNRPWGVAHVTVSPPQRRYTGIKRHDRRAGGFEGITAVQVERAVDELLDATPGS